MSAAREFVARLETLQEGERSRLRRCAGEALDDGVVAFDLFTGLWWPLREGNAAAPRREPSWLLAKLYSSFDIPHIADGPWLPAVLGAREPVDGTSFRRRFDVLIQTPVKSIELPMRWALAVAANAVQAKAAPGIDWARLLDHLSIWDRGRAHRLERDMREIWAEEYLRRAPAC